jgi:hypothetical protein
VFHRNLKKAHKQWSLCAFGEDFDLIRRVDWTIVELLAGGFDEIQRLKYVINFNNLQTSFLKR